MHFLNFIEYQQSALTCGNVLYEYNILYQDERKDVILLGKIPRLQQFSKNTCKDLLEFYINISFLKDNLTWGQTSYLKYYLNLDLIITFITLFCWLYILVVSIYTLHFTDLELTILKNFQDNMEPFSGLLMDE